MPIFDPDYTVTIPTDRNLFTRFAAPTSGAPAPLGQTASPVARPGAIHDAGEKIGAARKDLSGRVTVASLATLSDAEKRELVTKDNVWPRMDYRALAEEGSDRFRLAVVKRLRDKLPSAPEHRGKYGADRQPAFVAAVTIAHQVARRFLAAPTESFPRLTDLLADEATSAMMTPTVVAILDKPLARTRRYLAGSHRTALLAEIEQTNWPQVRAKPAAPRATDKPRLHERPDALSLERIGPPNPQSAVLDQHALLKTFSFRGIEFGNWESQDDRATNLQLTWDALHDLARLLDIPPPAIGLDKRLAIAFGARGRGHAVAHYEPARHVTNISKIRGAGSLAHEHFHALDHWMSSLLGGDATALATENAASCSSKKTTLHTVSARSVNEHYRLWHDRLSLADALNHVIKTIHFIPEDRAVAVSNARSELTRAEARSDVRRPAVQRYIERLRDKLAALEDGAPTRKVRTEYVTTAVQLGPYWHRPHELAARAFEAWLEDRLSAQGFRSPYLVRATTPDAWAAYRCCPYPIGAERAAINRAIDGLVAALRPFFDRLDSLTLAA